MEYRPWFAKYDKGVPVHIEYPEKPLFAFLDESAEKYPGRACTIFEGKESLAEQEVKKWCETFLAPFKIPSEVEFRTELPRTTVGKILRRELVRQHIERKRSIHH